MAGGLNKVQVIGHLGRDPELRTTQSGNAVCNFSVAVSESWNDRSGQRQESTEWFRIVTWGKTAENCDRFLHKGAKVYVEGKLQTRTYEDRDGNERQSVEVNAGQVLFLQTDGSGGGGRGRGGSRGGGGGGGRGGYGGDYPPDDPPPPPQQTTTDDLDDEIPF